MPIEQSASRAYAGFFVRMFAFLLDCSLFWLVSGTVRFPFWIYTLTNGETALTSPLIFSFSAWDIIIYLASAAYFILLTYCSGTTVGKRLMGLRVVSADGSRLTFWNVLYRETIGRYLSTILMLGYLMIGISSEKKALHDLICDTRVIYWTRPEPRYEKPVAPTKREEGFAPYVPVEYGASTPYESPVPPSTTYGTSTPPPTPYGSTVPPPPTSYGASVPPPSTTYGAYVPHETTPPLSPFDGSSAPYNPPMPSAGEKTGSSSAESSGQSPTE